MKPLLWDDLRVSLARANAGGDPPTWSVFRSGVYAQAFVPDAANSLMFDVQLPHSWALGTSLVPHLHWSPATTNTGNVRWGLEYSWANVNGVFPTSTIVYGLQAGSGVAFTNQIVSFGTLSTAGFGASSILVCRLFRDGANVADTYTGNAFGISLDFHYQTRNLGTVAEF